MGYIWHEGKGYGDWGNAAEILHMKKKSPEEQKARIKELWQKNPEKYYGWKDFCISVGALPNLLGYPNNPIPIDESKL